MNRIKVIILLLCSLGLVLFLQSRDKLNAANLLIITAEYLDQPPKGLNDPIWKEISSAQVPAQGRNIPAKKIDIVYTQAAYTSDTLYFSLTWKDPTRSVVKRSWKYNGKKWSHLDGNEDRIAMLFEVTRINRFATRGCAIICHSPADVPRNGWKLATKSSEEKGDLWHWKAARSAPYQHADDAWLTVAGDPSGSYRETGRRKDAGTGGDIKNQTQDGSMPLYMQDPAKKPMVPGFLLMEEAVKIKNYSIFKAGDVIPYRLPLKPDGSRFDVKAESSHTSGYWTVMIYRKLNTGHDDDVVFNPMKRYSFAMAVFDNSGSDHSKATQPLILTFSK